jgi:hypothetical protein
MTYAQILFELKRLIDLAYEANEDLLGQDLQDVLNQYDEPTGDCCG